MRRCPRALAPLLLLAALPARGQTDGAPVVRGELYIQRPRVLVLNLDPILPPKANQRLTSYMGWVPAATQVPPHVQDFRDMSHDLLRPRVAAWTDERFCPPCMDDTRWTEEDEWTPGSYLYAQRTGDWSGVGGLDYPALIRDHDVARRVMSGEIGEVWMFGAPLFGGFETAMAGRGAFYVNGTPFTEVPCSRRFVLPMYGYERGLAEMLHHHGHRAEFTLSLVYGGWEIGGSRTDWDRFTLYDAVAPGSAACGNVHWPPNADFGYDYANPRQVWSTADDWLSNFPNLTGAGKMVSDADWNLAGDHHRGYLKWWFTRMPHVAGTKNGHWNSWWPYLFDFNRHPETTAWPGAAYLYDPAGAASAPDLARRLTSDAADEWYPRWDGTGRIVWQEWDGNDYEIVSSLADGTGLVRITNNAWDDTRPRVSPHAGIVAWQSFDGRDTEIRTAATDGSASYLLTNDEDDDRDPVVNSAGRVAWWTTDGDTASIQSCDWRGGAPVTVSGPLVRASFPSINESGRIAYHAKVDGNFEIFTVDSTGSNPVRITESPWDDEFPEIGDGRYLTWMAQVTPGIWDIFRGPDRAGGNARLLTDLTSQNYFPRINARDEIVWMGFDGGDFEIWAARPLEAPRQITWNDTDDELPAIGEDGTIAWQSWDGHDTEIWASSGGIVRRLTINPWDDFAPAVSPAGLVAWHGIAGTGGTSEVFDSSAPPPILRRISGRVTVGGLPRARVTLTPEPLAGTGGEAASDLDGVYQVEVEDGWSGTVTPSKPGIEWTPASRAYAPVVADQTGQDYAGRIVPATVWDVGRVYPFPGGRPGRSVSLASIGDSLYWLQGSGSSDGTTLTGNGFAVLDCATGIWTPRRSPPLEPQTDGTTGDLLTPDLFVSMGSALLAPENGRIWMVAHAADNHDYWGGNRDLLRYDPASDSWEVFDNPGPNMGTNGIARVDGSIYTNWQGSDPVSRIDTAGFPAGTVVTGRALIPGGVLWPGALARGEGTRVWGVRPRGPFPAFLELYSFDGADPAPVATKAPGGELPVEWGSWRDGEPIGGVLAVPPEVADDCRPQVWVVRGFTYPEIGIYEEATGGWRTIRLHDPDGAPLRLLETDMEIVGETVYLATYRSRDLYAFSIPPADDGSALLRVTRQGTDVVLRWDSRPGACYRPLTAPLAQMPLSRWTRLAPTIAGTGSPLEHTDTGSAGVRLRFYLVASSGP